MSLLFRVWTADAITDLPAIRRRASGEQTRASSGGSRNLAVKPFLSLLASCYPYELASKNKPLGEILMAVERTLSIVKPDAVAKNVIGQIYSRFEAGGLKIIAARMVHLSRNDAEGFYAVHRQRPFFNDLVNFMISGPVMVQVLEGEQRDPEESRSDGGHRSEKSGQGVDSSGFRRQHRRQRGARLRCARDGGRGNRLFLSDLEYLLALMPVNLLDFDAERLAGFFTEIGEKPFRARQVMRWIHQFGHAEFESMSDLPKDLRSKLVSGAMVQAPSVMADSTATRWNAQMAAFRGCRQRHRDGIHSRNRARNALCIFASGLRTGMRVLLDWQAGLQSQSDGGRNHRPVVVGQSRARGDAAAASG